MPKESNAARLSKVVRKFVAMTKDYDPEAVMHDLLAIAATFAIATQTHCHDFSSLAHDIFHAVEPLLQAATAQDPNVRH